MYLIVRGNNASNSIPEDFRGRTQVFKNQWGYEYDPETEGSKIDELGINAMNNNYQVLILDNNEKIFDSDSENFL